MGDPPPLSAVLTAVPPLIGAGLVRLPAQPVFLLGESSVRTNIYKRVTDNIIADLKRGELTWQKPWSVGDGRGENMRPLRHNGTLYGGINVLILWKAALQAGFASPYWMTFKQATDLGAHVRKGERGIQVVYASTITKSEPADDGTDDERTFGFMKAYSVFNLEQIEGLEAHDFENPALLIPSGDRIAHADRFIAGTGAKIFNGGTRAYYSSTTDHIQMPLFGAFRTPQTYYATLAHELVHWTKHSSRLNRDFASTPSNVQAYAREELVAELGAAFLCADLGLNPQRDINHAAYIQAWLKILNQDSRAIFSAAAYAHRAAQFLHAAQSIPLGVNSDADYGAHR
jgi:antirestriction protein ArdC